MSQHEPHEPLDAEHGAFAAAHDEEGDVAPHETGETQPPDLGGALETPPLVTLLEAVQAQEPPDRIDQLWIFPPRRSAGTETAVVVLSLIQPDVEHRRVLTAHYTATRDKRGRLQVQHRMLEHADAAPDRLDRVIDGVLRRLDESLPPHPPRTESIGGDASRWHGLLHELRRARPVARRAGRY